MIYLNKSVFIYFAALKRSFNQSTVTINTYRWSKYTAKGSKLVWCLAAADQVARYDWRKICFVFDTPIGVRRRRRRCCERWGYHQHCSEYAELDLNLRFSSCFLIIFFKPAIGCVKFTKWSFLKSIYLYPIKVKTWIVDIFAELVVRYIFFYGVKLKRKYKLRYKIFIGLLLAIV